MSIIRLTPNTFVIAFLLLLDVDDIDDVLRSNEIFTASANNEEFFTTYSLIV